MPVAGIGLGLAAGGYVLYRRRVQTDRQQARAWLRDVLGEARAALSDEISYRFTDLQYALSVARGRRGRAAAARARRAHRRDRRGGGRGRRGPRGRRAAAHADREQVRAQAGRSTTYWAGAGR